MKRVTIIGSNFAALAALRQLRRLDRNRTLDLTVISPRAEFFYHPSLIWIPSGRRNGDDLKCNLTPFFQRVGVRHHVGEAIAIQDKGRTVVTSSGDVKNDALLIASGGAYMKKIPGSEHAINPCSGVQAAETVQHRLQSMTGGTIAMGFGGNPNEPSAMRGGPMFEFLFGIHSHLRKIGKRDQFKLVFFAPMPQPGQRLGPKAVKGLLAAMDKRNIDKRLGKKILGFDQNRIRLEEGEIQADLILFIPGMTGPKWFSETGFDLSPGGFLKADALCRVAGGERVYVAGDAGAFPGPEWRAKQAHMAELQAKAAARNLFSDLNGCPVDARFRTELICIVDTLDTGMLVSRFERFSLLLPPLRMLHWVKIFLEAKTMRSYRK